MNALTLPLTFIDLSPSVPFALLLLFIEFILLLPICHGLWPNNLLTVDAAAIGSAAPVGVAAVVVLLGLDSCCNQLVAAQSGLGPSPMSPDSGSPRSNQLPLRLQRPDRLS
jgi:hypothetical protein